MSLAELVSHVVGVDTHRDTHAASVLCAPTGGVVAHETVRADRSGYECLVEFADSYSNATARAWAIEGTGSYGAGLAAFLGARGEWVIEIDRVTRPRRDGAKSDPIDAERAAREALGRNQWAEPRARGDREALRILVATRNAAAVDKTKAINQLKALIVTAPDQLRQRLAGGTVAQILNRVKSLRTNNSHDAEYIATVAAAKRLARRIRHLQGEIRDHKRDIRHLTQRLCPQLLDQTGIGELVAAQAYVSWSHPGRCRNESAFAALAGTAPVPASSGQVTRHRLNRGGDRKLNRALHSVAVTRTRIDPRTQAYVQRRTSEGKSERETRRCLKRYIAREIYQLLENTPIDT